MISEISLPTYHLIRGKIVFPIFSDSYCYLTLQTAFIVAEEKHFPKKMWFLRREKDGKTVYLMQQEYTFGSSNDEQSSQSHVTITDDGTVRKKNIKFMVEYSSTENFSKPILKVMDMGSYYGAHIDDDDEEIQPHVWVDLKKGSLVEIGVHNRWVVEWQDIRVVCSTLGYSDRRKMTDTLSKLGGSVADDWREDLTHLVIGVIKMTPKVIDALISAKPLVTSNYFEAWKDALNTNPEAKAPDIKQFIPEIHPALKLQGLDKTDFTPKESRKTLFLGKTFLFPTKFQYYSVARSIEKAGGKSTMDLEQVDEVNQIILIGASDVSAFTKEYLTCLDKVKNRGHRAISMNEIILALIDGSTKRYCNPSATEVDQETLFSLSLPGRSLYDVRSYIHDLEAIEEATSNTERSHGEPPSKKKRSAFPLPDTSLTSGSCSKSSLGLDFGNLLTSQSSSDFVFIVAGQEIRAHKIILSARSPFFAAMFRSDMKEKALDRIDIPDIPPVIFNALLRFIYTDRVQFTETNAEPLLAAADKYLVPSLKAECEAFLLEGLYTGNCAEMMLLADVYNALHLKKMAQDLFRSRYAEIRKTEGWKALKQSRLDLAFDVIEHLLEV